MFNVQGSEMIFLLLIALVVLGPEKLPEAVRKFTKTYAEFKKTISGFQSEFRDVMDEPMRELRETADAVREAAKFDIGFDASAMEKLTPPAAEAEVTAEPAVSPVIRREAGLNFGSANPRRQDRVVAADTPVTEPEAIAHAEPDAVVAEPLAVEVSPPEDATA
ncbi:MAG TPA: twin-arginine translocase TatA/TatE family subunit [Ilumatobacteraceae bacterium]|nr:twin-arginine translocase TatA/TatE family subunit [Ilumatobacteraceae bacterium]HRB02415.1 twin-arginine translocase TatA/TatE family subunit [Ilumatobacteraceae bacterium]